MPRPPCASACEPAPRRFPIYVTYPGPAEYADVPEAGLRAERDKPVRVKAALGKRLLAQGWHESVTDDHGDAVNPNPDAEPGDPDHKE